MKNDVTHNLQAYLRRKREIFDCYTADEWLAHGGDLKKECAELFLMIKDYPVLSRTAYSLMHDVNKTGIVYYVPYDQLVAIIQFCIEKISKTGRFTEK